MDIPVPRNHSFFVYEPLLRLPNDHPAYSLEILFDHAHELVITERLQLEIDKIPNNILSTIPSTVTSHDTHHFAILGRIYVLLSFLASIYINTKDYDNPQPSRSIHPKLWTHLQKVAHLLGCKPVISYASEVFFNWRSVYNSNTKDNILCVNSTMTGSMDEAWFYTIPLMIESKSSKVIPIIVKLYEQCKNPDFKVVNKLLLDLGTNIKEMTGILKKMHDHCSPSIFYHGFRQYQMGWEGLHGASAAQSPMLQLLDALMNVDHDPSHTSHGKYLIELRPYMLPEHREFIIWVEKEWPVKLSQLFDISKSPIDDSQNMARTAFNTCIDNLKIFRRVHMGLVSHFLIQQKANQDPLVGSGDTDVLPFLQSIYSDTEQSKLD